ncbi:MAG: TPM domain-containing protein [Clostridium sp.]|nr:TPM domain-containing protein [Clostridium sp.]
MKRFFYCIIIILLGCAAAHAAKYTIDDVPKVQATDYHKHLSNPDGILSAAANSRIDSLLFDVRKRTSAEVAVVVVDDIDPENIDDFSTRLFDKWRIGKSDKDNGVLMVLAKEPRKVTIRTGYGVEGILPDVVCSHIIRNIMVPRLKNDDYDMAVVDAVTEMHRIMTNPEAAAELKSQILDSQNTPEEGFFSLYLTMGLLAMGAMLIYIAYYCYSRRGQSDFEKYVDSSRTQRLFWIVTVFFIGIPILASGALWLLRRHWRDHPRRCHTCGAKMQKLDEDTDNRYLSRAQDLEERIKSVDYDVWLCPKCGETDIFTFVNPTSGYRICGNCHAHTLKLTGTHVLRQPTYRQEGLAEKQYVCINCHHTESKPYALPKKEQPVVILPIGGGGRGGGGFGGFGGGSIGGGFGGGMTGGGGASGSW